MDLNSALLEVIDGWKMLGCREERRPCGDMDMWQPLGEFGRRMLEPSLIPSWESMIWWMGFEDGLQSRYSVKRNL